MHGLGVGRRGEGREGAGDGGGARGGGQSAHEAARPIAAPLRISSTASISFS